MSRPAPTLLLILDGYGVTTPGPGNAVTLAHTPTLDRLWSLPGRTNIAASGLAVGLPDGFMGNSEVGHLNIGAGRVVYQDMTRIDLAVKSGELANNPVLADLFATLKARGGRLHLMGLLSDGGVHSHIRHVKALIMAAQQAGVPVVVHAFMDGRDTSPTSGKGFIVDLVEYLDEVAVNGSVRLGSFIGRFYAMDRDKRWDRVKTAWDMLVHGQGQRTTDAKAAVDAAYADGKTDEFLPPHLLGEPGDVCIRDNDGVFFFNFRADRGRELAAAFHQPEFAGFERGRVPQVALASMTAYDDTFTLPVAFMKDHLHMTLGEVVSNAGLAQLRIAETEKYAHVTYFFSGGREDPFPGEARVLVDSPRDVATYDLKPRMSVDAVTDKLVAAIESRAHDLLVCNFANPDMVGHTGKIPAAVEALEAVDACVARVIDALDRVGGILLITADHGNAEELIDAVGQPQTAHTCNLVPLVVLAMGRSVPLAVCAQAPAGLAEGVCCGGCLADLAPTILGLWGLPAPEVMTGTSLLRDPADAGLAMREAGAAGARS